jgi:NADPH:quinone reductase-like Zn-dependent oxidoreductase
LGADETIDYKKTKFEDVVKNYDVVLDTVTQDRVTPSQRVYTVEV